MVTASLNERQATTDEMALVSNALAAYSFIADHPERAALYFVCGVCLGLVLTLIALVVQISCRTDCKRQQKHPRKQERLRRAPVTLATATRTGTIPPICQHAVTGALNGRSVTCLPPPKSWSAQRLEERERIIREIWMNGQPDMPGTRSLNRYY